MGKLKRERWSDADVKCPFYIADNSGMRSIKCEGCVERTEEVFEFETLSLREKHMGVYCVEKYDSCPRYKNIYSCKYGED